MWQHIDVADIARAKESLGHRLSQTLSRHADEIKALQAKQTEEISVLETKQGEIASLETLIERFAGEFQTGESADYEPPSGQDEIGVELDTEDAESDQKSATEASVPTADPPNGAGPLSVAYASPNFRPFRRLAS